MDEIQNADHFLQDIQSLSPETQKEAIDKKISDLVRQQLRLSQSSSPSTVPVPDTSPLHTPQEPSNTHFIEIILQTLRTKRSELEHIPTREELESLFHAAMNQPTKTEQSKALVNFFKACLPFKHIEILKEILRTESNFKIDELLPIFVPPRDPAAIIDSETTGETLLTIAVRQHNLEMVQLLTALGATPEAMSPLTFSPLMLAIGNKDRTIVQTLLASGANINKGDVGKLSPLTLAVENRDREMVQILLESHVRPRANINQVDTFGWTPLTKAIRNKDQEMMQMLLESHAKPPANIDQVDGNQWTPLTLAIMIKDQEMVQKLKELGADVNKVDSHGCTPLTLAVLQHNQEMVEKLKELGADINKVDDHGYTPLTRAVLTRDQEMVEKLKELGADINKVDTRGATPLTRAVLNKDLDMVRTLVTLRVAINTIDPNPLHVAMLQKNQPMIEFLENECHADPRIAHQLIDNKHTALLTGLYGRVAIKDSHGQEHTISLEGGYAQFRTQRLVETVDSFFSSPNFSPEELTQKAREHIKSIVHQTDQICDDQENGPNDEIVNQIHQGETVAISSGWKGHGISIVFSDNKIFICNRGEGSKEHAIMAYQCPSTVITKELITKLREQNCPNAQAFDAILQQHGVLGPALPEDCFDMRLQKVGNCSWANTKPIVQVLLYLELKKLKPTLSAQKLHEESHTIYKLWSAQVRMEATRNYLLFPLEGIVPEMLTKLVEKTVSCRSLTQEQKEELLILLRQKIEEKTKSLEEAGKDVPDTEEIKAIKAAEETHNMASLQGLLLDAHYRHNTLLVQRILEAYRPEDLPRLHAIAMIIAQANNSTPMLKGLERFQYSKTIQKKKEELSALLSLVIENKDSLMGLILEKLSADLNKIDEKVMANAL